MNTLRLCDLGFAIMQFSIHTCLICNLLTHDKYPPSLLSVQLLIIIESVVYLSLEKLLMKIRLCDVALHKSYLPSQQSQNVL